MTTTISPQGVENVAREMQVQMLGAGMEVGRSCCVIKYQGRTVVCDCGVHPAFSGIGSLPYIDELDWSTVDCLLITHFHVDHAACLTYIMEQTNFKDGKGIVYMSHPTKAVYRYLMSDFVRIAAAGTEDNEALYSEDAMLRGWASIKEFDFEQEIVIPASSTCSTPLRFTSFAAGHVLGACMFVIDIGSARVLYTGDYSTEEDRHLLPARVPEWDRPPDVMICESTYGVQSFSPREDRELRFTSLVHGILRRRGNVLLPVFALGRAQELLLVLDEYWSKTPELQHVPIYFVSSLAVKCLEIYKQYIHTMAPSVRKKFAQGINVFDFASRHSFIQPLEKLKTLNDRQPCVVMASPGFLTNGLSRELLEKWAPDPRNGVIITGYSVEGVMARTIMSEPHDIVSVTTGHRIPRRLSVDYVSFSAHVDYAQNSEFISQVGPAHLVLVHGEANNVMRLRSALKSRFANEERMASQKNSSSSSSNGSSRTQIHTPKNVDIISLRLRGDRSSRAVGTLAITASEIVRDIEKECMNQPLSSMLSKKGASSLVSRVPIRGVLVVKDFSSTFVAPEQLAEYIGLGSVSITEEHRMSSYVSWGYIKDMLRKQFGGYVEALDQHHRPTLRIRNLVDVKLNTKQAKKTKSSSSASHTFSVQVKNEDGVKMELDSEPQDTESRLEETDEDALVNLVSLNPPLPLIIQWGGTMESDVTADGILAVLHGINVSVSTVLDTSEGHHDHGHGHSHNSETKQLQDASHNDEQDIKKQKPESWIPDDTDIHWDDFSESTDHDVALAQRLERLLGFLQVYFTTIDIVEFDFDAEVALQKDAAAIATADPNNADSDSDSDSDDSDSNISDASSTLSSDESEDEDEAQNASLTKAVPCLRILFDDTIAYVALDSFRVVSANAMIADRVRSIVQRCLRIASPLDCTNFLESLAKPSEHHMSTDLNEDKQEIPTLEG